VIWDSTPKKRHPILRDLLKDAEAAPETYPAVRGTTHENAANLGEGYIEELERKYGGTAKGREELLGEQLDDSENATVRESWITKARRPRPDRFVRRAIGADPAVTKRASSDLTGIVLGGLGVDGQAYVLQNESGKYAPHEWGQKIIDLYIEEECDVVLVETNKGGDLVVSNLRAVADKRGVRIVEIGRDEVPRRTPGVINVKALYSQGSKEDRAQPVSTAYERGRVSHVIGANLTSLEDTLTTWEPGGKTDGNKSPDDLDALTFVVVELLGLTKDKPAPQAISGVYAAQQAMGSRAGTGIDVGQAVNRLLGGGPGKI
jgi:phage terminase large subunit-like protein